MPSLHFRIHDPGRSLIGTNLATTNNMKRKADLKYIETHAPIIGATIKPALYTCTDEEVSNTRSYIEVMIGLSAALVLDTLRRKELAA